MPRRSRMMRALLAVTILGLLVAAPASGSTTLGSTAGTLTECNSGISWLQTDVASRPSYKYSSATPGAIVSWSYRSKNGTATVRLMVWEPTAAPDKYVLRARSAYKPVTANTTHPYTESPGIPIRQNQSIGLRATGGNGMFACIFNNGNPGDVTRNDANEVGSSEEPAFNVQTTFTNQNTANAVVVSAVVEADQDQDNYGDETQDSCPSDPAVHTGDCAPGDSDADGVPNGTDNCPTTPNGDQKNSDADGQGDACDADDDGDGVLDANDNCTLVANADQGNADNAADGGNACDDDDDNDGTPDGQDPFPLDPTNGNVEGKATAGNDVLNGTANADKICGLGGDDQILGLQGNDTLFGDQCDVFARWLGIGAAAAGDGKDTLLGGDGDDVLAGSGGSDTLKGEAGNDKLVGGSGNDTLTDKQGSNSLDGGAGNDKLTAGKGKDKLVGGSGNDTLNGGKGRDSYKAGSGDDKIAANDKVKETIDCGKGKKDSAVVDKADKVKGCEKVTRK